MSFVRAVLTVCVLSCAFCKHFFFHLQLLDNDGEYKREYCHEISQVHEIQDELLEIGGAEETEDVLKRKEGQGQVVHGVQGHGEPGVEAQVGRVLQEQRRQERER